MKRKTIVTAMTALSLLATTSCIKETDIQQPTDRVQPEINTSVVTDTKALFTASSFSAGAQLGVFVRSSDGTPYNGILYDNVKYTAASSSSWSTDTPVWLTPENGLMYAYHPYSNAVTDITSIPVTAASQTDWLWAEPATGFSSKVPSVNLTMRHALAAVRLSLTKGSFISTGEVTRLKMTVRGAASSAMLDATDGSLSSPTREDITIEFTEPFTLSSSAKTFETIVVPDGKKLEIFLEMTVDGTEYKSSVMANDVCTAGQLQTFSASLTASSLQLYEQQVEAWNNSYNTQNETIAIGDVNLTLTGDSSNMTIEKKLDTSTGTLTVKVTPAEGRFINAVSMSGDAAISQSFDHETFVQTLTITQINSPITLDFSGTSVYNWITCVYDVEDTSGQTALLGDSSTKYAWLKCQGAFKRMFIDGQEYTPAARHTFSTGGQHTVTYLTDDGLTTVNALFSECSTLLKVTDSNRGFTVNATGANQVFGGCYKLTDVSGVKKWDTSKVTSMVNLFNYCKELQSLEGLEDWDVSNVTSLASAFVMCAKLEDVSQLSKWNTSKVTNFNQAFAILKDNTENSPTEFRGLTDLSPLKDWDVSSCTNMKMMFLGHKMNNLNGLENWNVSNVTNMFGIFNYCNNLSDISALTNWNTKNVTDMGFMFSAYLNQNNPIPNITDHIKELTPLKNWDVSSCTNFSYMFQCQSKITNAEPLSNWNTAKAENMIGMFGDCYALVSCDISNWDLSALTDCSNMFEDITTDGTLYYDPAKANHDKVLAVKPESWNAKIMDAVPNPFAEWARIQHVDGTLYTADEWLAAETAGTVTDADANGVAVRYSQYAVCPHVIHPKYKISTFWSTKKTISVGYITTSKSTSDPNSCIYDVNGQENTDAILGAISAGTIPYAPAAQYCVDLTFAGGQHGYLPAVGEVMAWPHNKTTINACMDAIGGDRVGESTYEYTWTSTQHSGYNAWYWYYYSDGISYSTKDNFYCVRAVSAFSYDPTKEYSNR